MAALTIMATRRLGITIRDCSLDHCHLHTRLPAILALELVNGIQAPVFRFRLPDQPRSALPCAMACQPPDASASSLGIPVRILIVKAGTQGCNASYLGTCCFR